MRQLLLLVLLLLSGCLGWSRYDNQGDPYACAVYGKQCAGLRPIGAVPIPPAPMACYTTQATAYQSITTCY